MTFYDPNTNVRRNCYADSLIETLRSSIFPGDSILSARGRYGMGPLYDIAYCLREAISFSHYDRRARELPIPRPLFRVCGDSVVEDEMCEISVRWRGYRCEEDEYDEDRPERDVRPFLSIKLEKKRTHVKVTVRALPSGRTKSFPLPFRLSDERTPLVLRRMIDFVLSVIDDECEVNASIAMREMVHTRSNRTFMHGPCPRCGSKSHLFM